MTTHQIKPITRGGLAAALQKAHRYRLLNDSLAAESICMDVLAIDPANPEAIVTWVLAITDQFPEGHADDLKRAMEALRQLADPYRHAYYEGIIAERWAKSIMHRGVPRAEEMAWEWVEKALACYERAEAQRPAGNDEAILRWNTCVRLLERHPGMQPRGETEAYEPSLE
jgi:hypothetical protein